jgi:chromosome segregation ATPase
MNLDDAPNELAEFVERVRVALHGEITSAKAIVATATADKERTLRELAEAQAQLKQVQTDLKSAHAYLQRGSTLAGLDHEITTERKALEEVKRETEEAKREAERERKALQALSKERNALNDEVNQLVTTRANSQEAMARIRHQLGL